MLTLLLAQATPPTPEGVSVGQAIAILLGGLTVMGSVVAFLFRALHESFRERLAERTAGIERRDAELRELRAECASLRERYVEAHTGLLASSAEALRSTRELLEYHLHLDDEQEGR